MATSEHDLVASASTAREIVESFRQCQIVVPDWEGTLQDVVEVLGSLPSGGEFRVRVDELRGDLAQLLQTGLPRDPRELDGLSTALREVVTKVRVPGVPRPEDLAWSF